MGADISEHVDVDDGGGEVEAGVGRMVEHVEKQMLPMQMVVKRVEEQMLKVQMLVRVEKQMGKLETGRHRPTDATTWGGNLIPENESFQRRCKEILDILTNFWGGAFPL